MKTFVEYIEHKKLEKSIVECANLMVEMDIDPVEYILEYVSKDPVMEKCLLENINEWEFGKKLLGAASKIGSSLWSGGGLKYGLQQAKDIMAGPAAKFDSAKRALQALAKSLKDGYLDSDGNRVSYSNIMSSNYPKYSIVQAINQLLKNLEREHANMPKMEPTKVNAPTMLPRGSAVSAGSSGAGSSGAGSSGASGP